MNLLQKLFTKNERKIIHDLASKPKIRKRQYSMWKCGECEEEYYFRPLRCPICTGGVKTIRRYTTFLEYPVNRYV